MYPQSHWGNWARTRKLAHSAPPVRRISFAPDALRCFLLPFLSYIFLRDERLVTRLILLQLLLLLLAEVTDESLGARKNAKNAKDQEHLLNY